VQFRALDELGLRGERFRRERSSQIDNFPPCRACDDEGVPRDRARVADLGIPLVPFEDRPPSHERERFVAERLDRHPRARHRARPMAEAA
jgi:hypothetical protein